MRNEKASGKSKLTLSVDKDIVNKAKSLGLNLSEIMENVLRSFTFTPSKTDKESVYAAYKGMFDLMLPLLKEYDSSVLVAKWTETEDRENFYTQEWELLQDGTFWNADFETEYTDITSIPSHGFLEPTKILYNFIAILSNEKERRKEKLEQIELARRIIAAIIESESKSETKNQDASEKSEV